jgi:hypothetical protein
MQAIQIDTFFEGLDDQRARVVLGDAASDASFDWGRIVAEGRTARAAADGGRWRIGLLAMLVEARYASGALQRFADEIGDSYATVRRYRWVAKAYDETARLRFSNLTFSHFQAVAGDPDRLIWLERAGRGRWSVDRLMRESRAPDAERRDDSSASLERLRSSIEQVRKLIEPASLAEDVTTAAAGREWLLEALDELMESVGRLRQRVHQATRVADASKAVRAARPKADRSGRSRSGPSRPSSSRPRGNALKARAVGR